MMNYLYCNARLFASSPAATHIYLIPSCYSHSVARRKIREIFSNYIKCANISHEPLARTLPLLTRSFVLQKRCNSAKSPIHLSSFSLHIQNKVVQAEGKKSKDTTTDECSSKEKVAALCDSGDVVLSSKPPGRVKNTTAPHIKEAADFSSSPSPSSKETEDPEKKLSLVQKFKLMYKQYWYVLIPVHVATSVVWYGAFFFAAKSGVDIVPILENMGATEMFLGYLRNSNAGYYGIAYAMYKIATPARYTVTIGGTTIAINYLKNRGYIKPVPTKEELKEMYVDKREEFMEKTEEMREKYQEKRNEIREKYEDKTGEMREKYQEKRNEIREKYEDKTGEMREIYKEKKHEFLDKYNITKQNPNDREEKR